MRIDVEFGTRDGDEAAPVAVRFGARRLAVVAVLDRWYGREHEWWKFDTEDGAVILRREAASGEWTLAAVPASGGAPSAPTAPPRRLH